MRNLKLIIEYDGAGFHGFQVQTEKLTVQGEIEKAICGLTGEQIRVTGSGRTDAGVHALEQVINFRTGSKLKIDVIKRALNSSLKHIAVREISEAEDSFDARKGAREREYSYFIYNGDAMPVMLEGRAWHVKAPLNLVKMEKAAKHLLGRHDFTSFCLKKATEKSCVRQMKSLSISRKAFDLPGEKCELMIIKVAASGFLWKMVRFIVGTLVRVGKGKLDPSEVGRILSLKDNKTAGPVAPEYGLYLTKVTY